MKIDLLDAAKHAAEQTPTVMRGSFEDWLTVLCYEDCNGQFAAIGFGPSELTDETLPQTLRRMFSILIEARAVQTAITTNVWIASGDKPGRARDREDREEMVLITHVTRDQTRAELAKVIRHVGQKPQLGPWSRSAQGLELGGSMIDILRLGIESANDEN